MGLAGLEGCVCQDEQTHSPSLSSLGGGGTLEGVWLWQGSYLVAYSNNYHYWGTQFYEELNCLLSKFSV